MDGSQVLASSEKSDFLFAHIFIYQTQFVAYEGYRIEGKIEEKSQRSTDETDKG